MPPLSRAWHVAATLMAPILLLWLRLRALRGKEIAARLPERRGIDGTARPPGRLLWLHAASVGETLSILPVIAALPARLTVLVTTGTLTSARLLEQRLQGLGATPAVLHRFVPLDVPAWCERFVARWRPDAACFVESEFWPNLLDACRRRGVPLALINARLSGRSAARWARMPGLARRLLGAFTIVLARSEEDQRRLLALGAAPVESWGDLKFAAPPLPVDDTALAGLARRLAGRPVWLAASTHPGEEAIVAAVHRRLAVSHERLLTIIVPRHPRRGQAIAASLGGAPRRATGAPPPDGEGIWIADTLGELGLFYRLAPIVFIGRSLAGHGGQNPLEPARLGAAICIGPHVANFADAVGTLRDAGALAIVADETALGDFVACMLADPARASAMGQAGRAVANRAAALPARIAERLAALAGA